MTPSPPIIIDTWKRKERLMTAVDESAAQGTDSLAAPEAAQSGEDFRRALAIYPDDDLRGLATAIYWARGALPKDIKRRVYVALRDFGIVIDMSRDPEAVLAMREIAVAPQVVDPDGRRSDGGEG